MKKTKPRKYIIGPILAARCNYGDAVDDATKRRKACESAGERVTDIKN